MGGSSCVFYFPNNVFSYSDPDPSVEVAALLKGTVATLRQSRPSPRSLWSHQWVAVPSVDAAACCFEICAAGKALPHPSKLLKYTTGPLRSQNALVDELRPVH